MSLDDRAGLPDPAVPVGGPAVFLGEFLLYCRNAWPRNRMLGNFESEAKITA
jgi:hypothetical protein